jgi:ribosomal protein L40E
MSDLVGFGIPYILDMPKTKEEKVEEARRSGLIGNKNDQDFVGAKYGQEIVCRRCGSKNVIVGMPSGQDPEKGLEIPYYCRDCGYEGTRVARVKQITDDGTLIVDLIPDNLIGVEGYGSFLSNY